MCPTDMHRQAVLTHLRKACGGRRGKERIFALPWQLPNDHASRRSVSLGRAPRLSDGRPVGEGSGDMARPDWSVAMSVKSDSDRNGVARNKTATGDWVKRGISAGGSEQRTCRPVNLTPVSRDFLASGARCCDKGLACLSRHRCAAALRRSWRQGALTFAAAPTSLPVRTFAMLGVLHCNAEFAFQSRKKFPESWED